MELRAASERLSVNTSPDFAVFGVASELGRLAAEAQMGRLCLPSGRVVSFSRFAIDRTYAGQMEGSKETCSQYILERLPETAAEMLSPAKPLVIVPPSKMPLPDWRCVAKLSSGRRAHLTDHEYYSVLYVCWFTDDANQSIDAMVATVLPHLDWERDAEDYSIC